MRSRGGCELTVSGDTITDIVFCFSATAHWDEKFHHKMVDNRGFMVTRSYTVGVTMMHRTGRHSQTESQGVGYQSAQSLVCPLCPNLCFSHRPL